MQHVSHTNRAGVTPISNSALNDQTGQNPNPGTDIEESFSN